MKRNKIHRFSYKYRLKNSKKKWNIKIVLYLTQKQIISTYFKEKRFGYRPEANQNIKSKDQNRSRQKLNNELNSLVECLSEIRWLQWWLGNEGQ